MFSVNLDSYRQDLRVLANGLTDPNPGGLGAPRIQRIASTAVAEVELTAGGSKIVVTIEESGLYVKGFRNEHGSFWFKGTNNGSSELRFNCSYSDPDGIAIFSGSANADARRNRHSRATIEGAVAELAAFRGGNDLRLKVPMGLLAFVLSEAVRFTYVYYKVGEVSRSNDAFFTFAQYQVYLQNWKDMSHGGVPPGAVPNKVYTAHSNP